MLTSFLYDLGMFALLDLITNIWLHWCDLADAFGGIWSILATIGESILS